MDIKKLKLRGFTGIRKGLGQQEIELDFNGMAGLIALSGPTGAGKTTIIENLQPYPQLVSRPQQALKNHVYLRDSIKQLSFVFNNQLIETEVRIDADSGRSEGYIYIDGESIVNGKISEYNRYIQELLGTPNLFFNSVFAAQNSAKISSLRPAELKALFTEFLGERLARLVDYENGAKRAMAWIDNKCASLEGRLDLLRENLKGHAALKEQSQTLAESIKEQTERLNEDIKYADTLHVKLEQLTDRAAVNNAAKLEKERCEKELAAGNYVLQKLRDQRHKLNNSHQAEIGDLDLKIAKERESAGQVEHARQAARDIKLLEEKVLKLTNAIDDDQQRERAAQAKIGRLLEDKASWASFLQELKDSVARTNQELSEKIGELRLDEVNLKSAIDGLENRSDIIDLNSRIQQAERTAANYENRGTDLKCDCGNTFACNSENCLFIQDALEAVKALPGLRARRDELLEKNNLQLEKLRNELAELGKKIESVQNERDLLNQESEKQIEVKNKLAELENNIKPKKRALAELQSTLEDKIEDKKELTADIEVLVPLAGKLSEYEVAASRIQQLEESQQAVIDRHTAASEVLNGDIKEAEKIIAEISERCQSIQYDPSLDTQLESTQQALTKLDQSIVSRRDDLARAETRLAALTEQLSKMDQTAGELAVVESDLTRLTSELAEWTYLRDACGADGLRALEIDLVAPGIAADANMLLERALGSWAMVDFRTQTEDGKEVLEPRVIDTDGDSVLIANRSGGQQVWALKALRLAMTLISKEKSGKNYLTAYADEDDAGLDEVTAQAYTKLYKEFMGLGKFNKVFFISHKPACVGLADHVIKLRQGGFSIDS